MTENTKWCGLTRRQFIEATALAAVSSGLAGCTGATGDGPKVAQTSIGYQSKPKGEQRCDNCKLWQPPAACQSVSGPISPKGWCNIYVKA